ncbi:MAG: tight adherence protein [Thermomicrobiales bacterium]|jgi:tight adherence protein B|nr:tight adherence protein [Thermomicrobiales bacterium]
MNMPILVLGIIAVAIVLIIVAMITRRREKPSDDEVMERMGRFATREDFLSVTEGSGGRDQPNKAARTIEEMVKGRGIAGRAASLLARADVRMTVGEFLLLRFGAAAGGFAMGFLGLSRVAPALGLLLGIITGLIGYAIPFFYLSLKAKRRRAKFVDQLGDTISLMANSLRAGYSLLQTMDMVARETPDPISTEFRRVVREIGLGISNQEAMENLLRRVPSDDLDLLVTAINIQHEVGGNLAQILSTIGHTIRERVRIKGEIGVLTAQVQISGYIITAMPIALGLLIFLMNPTYMLGLFVWPYICMPIASLVMIVIGYFVMRKITAIEV